MSVFNLNSVLDLDSIYNYNYTSIINDVDGAYDDLVSTNDVFTSIDGDIQTFKTEIDPLNITLTATNEYIRLLNNVSSTLCYCPNINVSSGEPFSRELLLNHFCSNYNSTITLTMNATNDKDKYWQQLMFLSVNEGNNTAIKCVSLYRSAYRNIFAEVKLTNNVKMDGNRTIESLHQLYLYSSQVTQLFVNITSLMSSL